MTQDYLQTLYDLAKGRDEEKAARILKQMRLSAVASLGSRFSPEQVSLEAYEVYHHGQEIILQKVHALVERLADSIKQGENLILFGTPGVGKDHIQACLLHIATGTHLLRGSWTSGVALFEKLSDHKTKFGELERAFASPDVAAISDPIPPGADPAPWHLNGFFGLIDSRYRARKSIWMTMNARDRNEIAAKLTPQIADRLFENALVLPCFWPSYRTRGQEVGRVPLKAV